MSSAIIKRDIVLHNELSSTSCKSPSLFLPIVIPKLYGTPLESHLLLQASRYKSYILHAKPSLVHCYEHSIPGALLEGFLGNHVPRQHAQQHRSSLRLPEHA